MTRTIYLAGELFSTKHLLGNALLAREIHAASSARYSCLLPQDLPQAGSPHAIRDQDLQALIKCDAAIFHYDGLELDSGTVVEYIFAKCADIPAVLLRTDFRQSGDQAGGDPWNLMNSFFPRTEPVIANAMTLYHSHLANNPADPAQAAESTTHDIARLIVTALDKVLTLPPILPREIGPAVYEWLSRMPAYSNIPHDLATLYQSKMEKALL